MGNRNRSNVLLVEILIAVLFFMLSATVLVQVFAASHNLTARAGVETRALARVQNVADALYAAEDPEALLEETGFTFAHGAWTLPCGDYTLYVETRESDTGAGTLWEGDVRAFYSLRRADADRQEDEELFAVPCVRYKEGQP